MKKSMLAVSAFSLALGLAACSNNENSAGEQKEKETVDLKQPMMKFYMELGKTINTKDVDNNLKKPSSLLV